MGRKAVLPDCVYVKVTVFKVSHQNVLRTPDPFLPGVPMARTRVLGQRFRFCKEHGKPKLRLEPNSQEPMPSLRRLAKSTPQSMGSKSDERVCIVATATLLDSHAGMVRTCESIRELTRQSQFWRSAVYGSMRYFS